MKRIISLVLSILLLGMLTACNQNVGRHADGIIKVDKATIEIGSTHADLDTFIVGFRLGAKMIFDTFCSDDAPFEDFLKD